MNNAALRKGLEVPSSNGLRIEGRVEKTPDGNLAVAVFLVNARVPVAVANGRDEAYAFQTHLALELADGFIGRTDSSDEPSEDLDDRVNDLQFRNRKEWAVGHGVSARVDASRLPVTRIETDWLPRASVLPVEARRLPGVLVKMEELAALTSAKEAADALLPMVEAYRAWIDEQAHIDVGSAPRQETRDELVRRARHAADRIEAGIRLLEKEPLTFDTFRWMNSVMGQAEPPSGASSSSLSSS